MSQCIAVTQVKCNEHIVDKGSRISHNTTSWVTMYEGEITEMYCEWGRNYRNEGEITEVVCWNIVTQHVVLYFESQCISVISPSAPTHNKRTYKKIHHKFNKQIPPSAGASRTAQTRCVTVYFCIIFLSTNTRNKNKYKKIRENTRRIQENTGKYYTIQQTNTNESRRISHDAHVVSKNVVSQYISVTSPSAPTPRGGGLGSRPKKMYGERLGDGVEYHLMKPTPRR